MKKKVISILLTAVLATGMAACGSNNSAADTSADNTTGMQKVQQKHLMILPQNLY